MEKTLKKIELRVTTERGGILVDGPETIAQAASRLCDGQDWESFFVFMLDGEHKVIGYSVVGQGGVNACPVDPRLVFRAAVHLGSTAIVLVHNHPSGNLEPSKEDMNLTSKLSEAASLLDINLLDHVIVGADQEFTSFVARGLLR